MLKPRHTTVNKPCYRGRFAPTPSGPLHFGSLVAALGSYLDAKAHQGQWLVRIEDVDKTRAVSGADEQILEQLTAHGLLWDDTVIYQSQRDKRYQAVLTSLANDIYSCDCSRRQIRARGVGYDGYCRSRQPRTQPHALRFANDNAITSFHDRWHGNVQANSQNVSEDFIVRRRDGLYAYQLAVVVDDIDQGITDIVRGSDLLEPSFWQLSLWQRLTGRLPQLMHLPLIVDASGRKLSKQNHAPALDNRYAVDNVKHALTYLQLAVPTSSNLSDVLKKATIEWSKKWHIGSN